MTNKSLNLLNETVELDDKSFDIVGLIVNKCNYQFIKEYDEFNINLEVEVKEEKSAFSKLEIQAIFYDDYNNIIDMESEYIDGVIISKHVVKFSIEKERIINRVKKTLIIVSDCEYYERINIIEDFLRSNTEVFEKMFELKNLRVVSYKYSFDYGFNIFIELATINGDHILSDCNLKMNVYNKNNEIIYIARSSIISSIFNGYDTISFAFKDYIINNANCVKIYLI